VVRGRHADVLLIGPFAVKIFRRGLEKNAEKEWRVLKLLEKYRIGPKPYLKIGRVIVMERIRGRQIRDMSEEEIRAYAKDFLKVLHLLDELGIQKEECHRPDKHFFITPEGVRLIDFERAHFTENPHNVTQFLAYLSRYFRNVRELAEMYRRERNIEKVISELR